MSDSLNIQHIDGFTLRVVERGECYGLNDGFVNQLDEPIVEIFVGSGPAAVVNRKDELAHSYRSSSLLKRLARDEPWELFTGVPEATLDVPVMRTIASFVKSRLEQIEARNTMRGTDRQAQTESVDGSASVVREPTPKHVPADEDPLYRAQMEGLKQMTAAINAGFEYQRQQAILSSPVVYLTMQGGVLTMPDGESIDLAEVQAALNFGFQETGDPDLMEACDRMARITGLDQGPSGEFVPAPALPTMRGSTPADRCILAMMDEQALIDEIQRRGRVVTVWSPDDLEFIGNEDHAAEDLSQEQLSQIQQKAFDSLRRSLEDITVQRGNEFLGDWWEQNKASLLPLPAEVPPPRESMR